MTPDRPLAGCIVLVTRAAAQAAPTLDALAAVGASGWCIPTLAITPSADPTALPAALAELATTAIAIFTSANAVAAASPALLAAGGLPADTLVAALGAATAAALRARGLVAPARPIVVPAGTADSEALLADPAFARLDGRRVVIFTGDEPRAWLAATLTARGARVRVTPVYARACPPPVDAGTARALASRPLHAVTAASAQGLRHLYAMVDPVDAEAGHRLRALPHVVTHPRIAAVAADTLHVRGPVAVADDAHGATARTLVGILAPALRPAASP